MSNSPPDTDEIRRMSGKLTLAEIGVIFSLLMSIVTGSFVFGVMYGQVSENTKFREVAMRDMLTTREDIASIKTSVEYLVEDNKDNRSSKRGDD